MLKAQDVVVACYLRCYERADGWTYALLGKALGLSTSRVYEAVERGRACHLYSALPDAVWRVHAKALLEFCCHGLRYVFPALLGAETRGWPTAHAAMWVQDVFVAEGGPVWPDAEGPARGPSLEPLHHSVLIGQRQAPDESFYRVMTALDLLRCGQARERAFAQKYLHKIWNARG